MTGGRDFMYVYQYVFPPVILVVRHENTVSMRYVFAYYYRITIVGGAVQER